MPSSDLLVRGGVLVDGTGRSATYGDVRMRRGRIVEVGPNLRPGAELVIDAAGAIVVPGFIESHTHLDPSLFWDPLCDPLPQHGVTTVVTGNCSLSLAPVWPRDRDDLVAVFSYIEDIPPGALADAVPWSWTNWAEYQRTLAAGAFGVNVAPLVGHTPLRTFVMGPEAWTRQATPTECTRIAHALSECLAAGAFGLSSSFFDEDASKRPVPSRMADEAELAALLDVVAWYDAMFTFIPRVAVHDDMLRDVERVADLCRPRHVTATWNGLFHNERRPERAVEALKQASRLQGSGAYLFPQVSPRRVDVRVNWDGGMAFYSLPAWHQITQASPAGKVRLLNDQRWRAEARAGWDAASRTLIRHRELDRLELVSVTRPEYAGWVGRTLADLVTEHGGHPSDVLADWVLTNDCAPGVVGAGIANGDPEGVAELLRHPATVVSNSDTGAHVQMMCGAGDSTLLLTRHVYERGDLPLPTAIWELTGRQARLYGIADRGLIAPGMAADLVVFDLDELSWQPEAIADDMPGGGWRLRRPPGGFRYTIVGGEIVQQQGICAGARPGRLLTHRAGGL